MEYHVHVDDREFDICIEPRLKKDQYGEEEALTAEEKKKCFRKQLEYIIQDPPKRFRIIGYIKMHPEAFLAFVSMLAALFVFICRAVDYVTQYETCTYWNIDYHYISISSNTPVFLAIYLVFSASMIIVPYVFRRRIDAVIITRTILRTYIINHQQLRKEFRKNLKDHRKVKRISDSISHIFDGDQRYRDICEAEAKAMARYEEVRRELNALRGDVLKTNVYLFRLLFLDFFMITILSGLITALMSISFGSTDIIRDFILVSLTMLISSFGYGVFRYRFCAISELKKAKKDDKDIFLESIRELMQEKLHELSIKREGFLSELDDEWFKKTGVRIAVMVIMLVVSIIVAAHFKLSKNRDFLVTTQYENSYIVILENDNEYVLKHVIIDETDNSIFVDLDSTTIVTAPIAIVAKKFDKVTRK